MLDIMKPQGGNKELISSKGYLDSCGRVNVSVFIFWTPPLHFPSEKSILFFLATEETVSRY
jgi:hypothetical protein